MHAPIAIVRTAALGAMGVDLDSIAAALRSTRCGVGIADALEQAPAIAAGVGQVDLGIHTVADGDSAQHAISRVAASDTDRAERLFRRALAQLLGADPARTLAVDPSQVAIVVGTTLAGMRHCGAAMRLEAAGHASESLQSYAGIPAGSVLRRAIEGLPIAGGAITVSCACASALSAIAHGCSLLRSGAASCVIAGGYDPISEFAYGGFSALQLVAAGPLSPFAEDRQGMKLAEGCALLLLRRLPDALARGEVPVAIIEAIGESSDAHHLTQPHPEGRGASVALAAAVSNGTPDLLIAHATGTAGNDAAEYEAYRTAFGADLSRIPVTALKSRFGHPLGAAGALELLAVLKCADAGFMPAGLGRPVDRQAFPEIDLLHENPRPGAPTRVTVLAAGFGGANVAMSVIRGVGASAVPENTHAREASRVGIRAVGCVSAGGRGIAGLEHLADCNTRDVSEEILAPLLDRARTRRLALLPRLMLAATRDLCDASGLSAHELASIPLLAASWHGAAGFTEQYYRDLLASGIDLANPVLFAESVPNVGSAHVSLGLGMTAASATVIGTRTAGFEAMFLASCRIRSGEWKRALIVMADESHPTIDAVLGNCTGSNVRSRSAGIAFLMERIDSSTGNSLPEVMEIGRAQVDRGALRPGVSGHGGTAFPEIGCVAGPAALALEIARPRTRDVAISSADPNGFVWTVQASAHGVLQSFATV
ncbi:MAG: beta-ketoacyl synthase N-terminal-like domain-containing protein [Planctomycetota bacterium]|nr:beta-ketoacyl synthase N-terminal-like domain-containing protein [Planctomycetota bacterium]